MQKYAIVFIDFLDTAKRNFKTISGFTVILVPSSFIIIDFVVSSISS